MKFLKKINMVEVAGTHFAVVCGEDDKDKMIKLNDTAFFIFENLKKGLSEEIIADKICEKYDNVTKEKALKNIADIVEILKNEKIV